MAKLGRKRVFALRPDVRHPLRLTFFNRFTGFICDNILFNRALSPLFHLSYIVTLQVRHIFAWPELVVRPLLIRGARPFPQYGCDVRSLFPAEIRKIGIR